MMFVSFGLFTPPNPTRFRRALFRRLAIATSTFLIEETSHPLRGCLDSERASA
jgi:hypothetical protein